MLNYYVGIMAGGIGSRFWPVSRNAFPKQFIDFLGTGKSLLQMTYDRFVKFIPPENIYIITGAQYVALTKEQLPQLSENQIIAEPERRNTAPCIAYFANKIFSINEAATMLIAPSDHLILDETAFVEIAKTGLGYAEKNNDLLTIGIKPTRPDTGYGYIQYKKRYAPTDNIFRVKTFTEKPPLELAKTFLSSGEFLWNSGMFIWNAKAILKAFDTHLRDIANVFKPKDSNSYNTENEQEFIDRAYSLCTNISIDYGILEKADNVLVIPGSFSWSDLGTWGSLHENMEKDYLDNAVSGENVIVYGAVNNMVHSDNNEKVVILSGIENATIVDTDNVLLIFKQGEEQKVKEYMADVKRKKGDAYL